MNALHKVFGFLLTSLLAVFALSSGAAFGANEKTYTISTASSPTSSTVVFTLTPLGNSSFNSFSVVFPANPPYSVNWNNATATRDGVPVGQVSSYPGGLQVNGITVPVGTQNAPIKLTITNVTTTGGTCGSGVSGTWTFQPWTGTPVGSGQRFQPSPGTATTSINPTCYTATSQKSSTGDGSGSITPSSIQVPAGNTATFSVTVNSGSSVTVADNCGGSTSLTSNNDTSVPNSINYTTSAAVPANGCQVTATFALRSYTVSTTKTGTGTWATGPGSKTVTFGQTTTFNLAPAGTSDLIGATDTCNAVTSPPTPAGSRSGSTWTTGAVPVGGCTVTATYALKQGTVKTSMSGTGGGTITPSADQTVDVGTTLTFKVRPGLNSRLGLGSVSGCSGALSTAPDGNGDYTYTTGQVQLGTCTVNAEFTLNTLTLTAPTGSIGAGSPIHIGVSGDGPTVVQVTASGAGCQLSPAGPLTIEVVDGVFEVTIAQKSPPATQTCTLYVSAANYSETSLQLTSMYGGVLGCDDDTNYDSSYGKTDFALDPTGEKSYSGTPGWGLRRGPNYSENETCVPVNYTCSLDNATKVLSCIYDKTQQSTVVLKYVVLWPAVSITNGGSTDVWKDFRPYLSWPPGPPPPIWAPNYPDDYVPGLNCVTDDETQGLALLPIIPNIGPWAGNAHTQFQPGSGKKAKMCIGQLGSTSMGVDPASPTTKFLVQPWHIVLDLADGYAKLPQ